MNQTALFRITLWQAKKPSEQLSRHVSEVDTGSAVFCAQQWVCWSREAGRGKRRKFDRYQVEVKLPDGAWQRVAEGTLQDAKMEQPAEDISETASRARVADKGGTQTRARESRSGFRVSKGVRASRLGAMVAQVKGLN